LEVGIGMENRAVFGPNLEKAVRSFDAAGLIPFWERMDTRQIRKGIFETEMKTNGKIKKDKDPTTETRTLTWRLDTHGWSF
jgi:hypothetical protein